MFNLAPPPSWVSKALFRAPGSPECRYGPEGPGWGTGLIITTVVGMGGEAVYFEMSSIQPPPVIKVEGTFNND